MLHCGVAIAIKSILDCCSLNIHLKILVFSMAFQNASEWPPLYVLSITPSHFQTSPLSEVMNCFGGVFIPTSLCNVKKFDAGIGVRNLSSYVVIHAHCSYYCSSMYLWWFHIKVSACLPCRIYIMSFATEGEIIRLWKTLGSSWLWLEAT